MHDHWCQQQHLWQSHENLKIAADTNHDAPMDEMYVAHVGSVHVLLVTVIIMIRLMKTMRITVISMVIYR